MAYVDIPKDLDGIKTKVALGLTKRQLIGFGTAAVIGIPVYLTTRAAVGNDFGLILMIITMALPLLYGIYEPKGMTVEQYLIAWLRFQFVAKGPRPYQTINLYDVLLEDEKEAAKALANQNQKTISKTSGSQPGSAKCGSAKAKRRNP